MTEFFVENLSFAYPKRKKLFDNFNFYAKSGEVIYIKGKSGAGKSSLLKIFCTVIPKVVKGDFYGDIKINGVSINLLSLPEVAPYISYLMQEPDNQLIFPSVEDELAFASENLCLSKDKIEKRINFALDLLNIKELRFSNTATLSYGQKKLVAFASIITLNPLIYLLDEPFSGLSNNYIKTVKNAIKSLAERGRIIFFAGHLNEFENLADRIINL